MAKFEITYFKAQFISPGCLQWRWFDCIFLIFLTAIFIPWDVF